MVWVWSDPHKLLVKLVRLSACINCVGAKWAEAIQVALVVSWCGFDQTVFAWREGLASETKARQSQVLLA